MNIKVADQFHTYVTKGNTQLYTFRIKSNPLLKQPNTPHPRIAPLVFFFFFELLLNERQLPTRDSLDSNHEVKN